MRIIWKQGNSAWESRCFVAAKFFSKNPATVNIENIRINSINNSIHFFYLKFSCHMKRLFHCENNIFWSLKEFPVYPVHSKQCLAHAGWLSRDLQSNWHNRIRSTVWNENCRTYSLRIWKHDQHYFITRSMI